MVCCVQHEMLRDPSAERLLTDFIVLLQFQWPLYDSCFAAVRRQVLERSFLTFSGLFAEVYNVDILEEILALVTRDNVRIELGASARRSTREDVEGMASRFEQHVAKIADEPQAVAMALATFVHRCRKLLVKEEEVKIE